MNVSSISFSSAKKQKKNNIVRSNDKQVNVSVPQNYKIVIKPGKEKLVMTPQEDVYVSSDTDTLEEAGKTSQKDKKIKAVKNSQENDNSQENNKSKKTNDDKDKSVIEKAKKITRIVVAVIMTALSALGLKEGKDMLDYEPDVSSTVVNFNSDENNISDIASSYNIDEDVIRYINGIYSDDDLDDTSSLKIPTYYDYMYDIISDKTQEMYKTEPYSPEYYSISKDLDALVKKNDEQKAIADTFKDEDTVYISIKTEEENPELAKKFEDGLVSDEYIEKLFDIKKGELHKYNTFISKGNNQYVYLGTTIKVPLSAIDTENINLSAYYSK